MKSLTVERFETLDALRGLEQEWRSLSDEAHRGLPFLLMEWQLAWWKHMRARQRSVEDRLYVHAVRDGSGELVAVAPFMITARPSIGPLQVRELQLFGADPNLTELRAITCRAGCERDVLLALRRQVRAQPGDWDWINWGGLASGSEAERALDFDPDVSWVREVPDFILPLPSSWEEFKGGLKRNIKESLRKCQNAPRRDGLEPRLEVVQSPEGMSAALQHLYRLHNARAQREDTVRHRDVFATEQARAFLTDVCNRLAQRDRVRIFLLHLGEKVVAVRVGFVLGDSLYLYYSGYDPEYGQYSVMTAVVADAIRWAIESGLKTVNLSTGEDVSKTRWGPEAVLYREPLELSPGFRGRMAWESYQKARRALASHKIRTVAQRFLTRRAS